MAKALREEIRGLRETQKKTEQVVRDLKGEPFLQAMRDSTLYVQRDAKINAPVDTGRLRASITPDIRSFGDRIEGVVGSNVVYAPYVELGTKPHFPPLAALATWARRHGRTAFVVARAISQRGTKAREFLKRALMDNKDRIVKRLNEAVSKIAKK